MRVDGLKYGYSDGYADVRGGATTGAVNIGWYGVHAGTWFVGELV